MFNNHHLPKSLLNEVASVLNNTNADFDLPQVLQDVVAEAARDYVMCPTREDRKAIIEWHIEQVMSLDDVEQQTIVNFERAIEYAANGGKIMEAKDERVGLTPEQKQTSKAVAYNKRLNTVRPGSAGFVNPDGRVTRIDGTVPKISPSKITKEGSKKMQDAAYTKKLNTVRPGSAGVVTPTGQVVSPNDPRAQVKNEQFELLDVLASLNEEEFHAYIDLLSESEIQLLEQIINENN